ncbi:type II toxin-antitoxin system CcdA family antitoxin [Mesorhizobium sp. J428]|uniref:type II toxin-antitoxin system CcdA family antitoxin n=1 Tax=Mesorhizobium sp. J428 TaxID=2898440 RepID=UPI00215090FC|nr:type II toxin-antitoxin system CcdA family antitoxin [Mesorhizobium sp. J428]MCR5856953.1 type II toxin-antitoxin system CcdA family antitoxin [Mesorhizobium sp. J428]
MSTKMSEPRRKATKLLLDDWVVAEARELELDVSRIVEEGLAKAVAARKSELWLEENREAIEENNRYFAEHGLPFSEFRGFE